MTGRFAPGLDVHTRLNTGAPLSANGVFLVSAFVGATTPLRSDHFVDPSTPNSGFGADGDQRAGRTSVCEFDVHSDDGHGVTIGKDGSG